MITHNPLHGSGRAALPHPALALGNDAHATQGRGMTNRGQGQPTVEEAPHTIPKDAAVLTAPPFLNKPHDTPVCDPVLHELHKPLVRKAIEGLYDTLPISRTFLRE
jgi:hypothetical protein